MWKECLKEGVVFPLQFNNSKHETTSLSRSHKRRTFYFYKCVPTPTRVREKNQLFNSNRSQIHMSVAFIASHLILLFLLLLLPHLYMTISILYSFTKTILVLMKCTNFSIRLSIYYLAKKILMVICEAKLRHVQSANHIVVMFLINWTSKCAVHTIFML